MGRRHRSEFPRSFQNRLPISTIFQWIDECFHEASQNRLPISTIFQWIDKCFHGASTSTIHNQIWNNGFSFIPVLRAFSYVHISFDFRQEATTIMNFRKRTRLIFLMAVSTNCTAVYKPIKRLDNDDVGYVELSQPSIKIFEKLKGEY